MIKVRIIKLFLDPNENQDEEQNDNFGFKSPRTPPQNRYLKAFEKDMYQLTNKVEFDNRRNHFQRQLRADVAEIKTSNLMTMMKKQIAQRLRVLTRPQTGLNNLMICRCLHMPLLGIRFRFGKDQSWLQIDGRMQPEGCNRCRSKPPFFRDGSY